MEVHFITNKNNFWNNNYSKYFKKATRVYMAARSALHGKLKGLCGNNDGDILNDRT